MQSHNDSTFDSNVDSIFIIKVRCQNRPGIVHQLTESILELKGDILEFDQVTLQDQQFICRIEFTTPNTYTQDELRPYFNTIIQELKADLTIINAKNKFRMGILVSQQSHCLMELLYQMSVSRLPVTIPFIISNHPNHQDIATYYNIPFYHVDVTTADKGESDILNYIDQKSDFLVLARYMQIISSQFIESYNRDIINVHHSLLPSFKGGNPYQQAYNYGVKLIGATSHFVTETLDEGPIIEQDTVQINHRHTVEEIKQHGHWIEKKVLAETCRLYSQNRIIRGQTQTIVFK
jgi:formyltetrahydrofolate deformylase